MKKKIIALFCLVGAFIVGLFVFGVSANAATTKNNSGVSFNDTNSLYVGSDPDGTYYLYSYSLSEIKGYTTDFSMFSFDFIIRDLDSSYFDLEGNYINYYYIFSTEQYTILNANLVDNFLNYGNSVSFVFDKYEYPVLQTIYIDISNINFYIQDYYLYILLCYDPIFYDESCVDFSCFKFYEYSIFNDDSVYDSGFDDGYSAGFQDGENKGNEEYDSLWDTYTSLIWDYDSLQADYDFLLLSYRNLEESYNKYLNDEISFTGLFWDIAAIPFESFKQIWNVDFLGVNLANFVTGLLSAIALLWIIKKLI